MNGKLMIPRFTPATGRLIRVSDFLVPEDEVPRFASYFPPGHAPYQTNGDIYSEPTVLIDVNIWTPVGTSIGIGPHGILPIREGAWSYITPNDWIPTRSALRVPQNVMLTWNSQTFDDVPGDRPDLDTMQTDVRSVFGDVQDWLVANRAGRTWAQISVVTGITTVPPQPPVTNDPGFGLFPVEVESYSLIRGGSQAVVLDDTSEIFFGTNTFCVSVGLVAGGFFVVPIGSEQFFPGPPSVYRMASYKVLVYDDPHDETTIDGTRTLYADSLAFLESQDWGQESEYGFSPTTITFEGLLADIADFFGFDPDTGVDNPL